MKRHRKIDKFREAQKRIQRSNADARIRTEQKREGQS